MNNQIEILRGPDRVRKRPAVIFLSKDIEGVQQALRELAYIFLVQARLGHCTELTVRQEGDVLEFRGNDRGLDLGQATGDDSKWQSVFCELYPLPATLPKGEYTFGLMDRPHHNLYGDESRSFPESGYMELYALQCVSAFMDVSVNRNGIHSTLHFERGYNIGGIRSEPTAEANGTCFRFRPDGEVFTETTVSPDFLLTLLQTCAALCPGLRCTYENADGTRHPVEVTDMPLDETLCRYLRRREEAGL